MALPLHVLVRDWPELDPVLRESLSEGGLERTGHLTLVEALGGVPASLEAQVLRMEAETGWRGPPRS